MKKLIAIIGIIIVSITSISIVRSQTFLNGNFEKNYHGGTKCTEVHRVNSLCESQCSPILRGKKTRLILSPVNPP